MTTSLSLLIFRGTRRVRLVFTGNLAAGAFASTSFYTVTNTDGLGVSPTNVVAVFAVTGAPTNVELAIDEDLASGAAYLIGCTAVPCADLSNFTGTLASQVALELTAPTNVEPQQDDLSLLLYGRDLAHDGTDFVEDASGDLGTISGRPNWKGAMTRRFGSDGLAWDVNYGPQPDQYVDAPQTYQQPLAGALVAQARQDDRNKQATVSIQQDPSDPGGWEFQVELLGIDNLDPLSLTVQPPTS